MINTVIALSLIVIALIGTEIGYLLYLKRDFQKAADLAALAGAQGLDPVSCGGATAAARSNANGSGDTDPARNLPQGFSLDEGDIECGRWVASEETGPGDPAGRRFDAGALPHNAVRVHMQKTPQLLLPNLPGNSPRPIFAEAIAAQQSPRAALNIRSTLVSVNSARSPILNAAVGGLLGGSLNIDAVGWQGLVDTDVQLLQYLDQLAIDLNLEAGNYEQVLATETSVGQLLGTMITVLERANTTAQATLGALRAIQAAAQVSPVSIALRELVNVQAGAAPSALRTDLQVFQLVQAMAQAANGENALVSSVAITVPFVANARVDLRVVEPMQVSAIGNPELASLDPYGSDGISVRTAQVRALVSLQVPGLSAVAGLLNAVTDLLTPVTSLLNSVLSLNLQALVGNILCLNCTQTRVVLAPNNPIQVSVGLEVAAGEAVVTDVDCSPASAAPSLTVAATTSAAHLRVGQLAAADVSAFLSPAPAPAFAPIPLMDVETRRCTTIIVSACTSWAPYARTGLLADTTVGQLAQDLSFSDPPPLEGDPDYQAISTTNVVSSLQGTLSGLQLRTHEYNAAQPNALGNFIGAVTGLGNTVLELVRTIVARLLSPLLDPLVNALLVGLGIDLAQSEVGARLSCQRGATLVY